MKYLKKQLLPSIFGVSTLLTLVFPIESAQGLTFRSIDGSNNNITNPTWGQANTSLLRITPNAYGDGISSPRSLANNGITPLPNPRDISNVVSRQNNQNIPNSLGFSDWLFQWGQFIDHDLDLNEPVSGTPSSNISVNPIDVATGLADPLYSPTGIPFTRNQITAGTGTNVDNPAQHPNKITAYLDASMVYGSSINVANELRTTNGKLKSQIVNGEELLAFVSQANVPVANPLMLPNTKLFAAGDPRVNEQIGLTAIHTLMVREHNRLATDLKVRLDNNETELVNAYNNSGLSEDDFIYQSVRKVVGAQVQIITYNEFLPLLLGHISTTAVYDNTINAGITEEFANAAYRFGHTTLSPSLLRVNNDYQVLASIFLGDAFFNTQNVIDNGIDSVLMGLSAQTSQAFDPFLVDGVRNFLFPAASGGSDLASVNIARGRDVGLGSLNDVRRALGLTPYNDFAQINSNPLIVSRLSSIYASVEDVDLWVGGLSEDSLDTDILLGETFGYIIRDQFNRLRDGDRFFYTHELDDLRLLDPNIDTTTLSQLILRNSSLTTVTDDVFFTTSVPEASPLLALFGLGLWGILSRYRR